MSVHRKPDGRWYVSYRDEFGRQRTKTFDRESLDRRLAEAFDLEVKAKKKRRESLEPQRELGAIYLDELAQLYLDDCKARGCSVQYLKNVASMLNNHALPLLGVKPVQDLTYSDCLQVAARYAGRTTATINRNMEALKRIFRWGVRHGYIQTNPMQAWTPGKEPRRQVRLTVDDLKKIHRHAAPHLQWIIEVEWNLGTRPGASELLSLRWDNVDFDKRCVWVYATKTKEWRSIPVSDDFMRKLLERKAVARTEYVIEYKGRPIRKVRRAFQTAARKAGITYPVRLYDIRHLFASVMLAGGADLAAVSKLLGHASTKMTADVYYEMLKGEKEDDPNKRNPRQEPDP